MRWGLFFFVCLCHAQTTIHVRDEAGRPIENAQLQFSGSKLFEEHTDATGTIVIAPKDPFAVVRKPGFLSARVNLAGPEVNVTLQRAEREWRECPLSVKCDFGTFCFPPSKEIAFRGSGSDVDYFQRFYARNSDGRRPKDVISYGNGSNWSSGLPQLRAVERSATFREEAFSWNDPVWILDSRGTMPGWWWRQIGMFNETVSYETSNKAVADAFDKFLDTMCLRPGTVK